MKRIVHAIKASYPLVPIIGFPRGAGPLVCDYVRETGIQAVSLDTGMSTNWARDNVQPLTCVQGNLDPLLLVAGGKEMRAGVTHIMETLGNQPFIFNLGHGIVPKTPPDHVDELVELVRGFKA